MKWRFALVGRSSYTHRVKSLERQSRGPEALLDESGGVKLSRSGIEMRCRNELEGVPRSIQSNKCNGRGTRPAVSFNLFPYDTLNHH